MICLPCIQTGRLHHTGVFPTMHSILKVEGVPGLFRGNGASVLRIIPYSAVHFGLYEQYRRLIVHLLYENVSHPSHIAPAVDLLAGAAAGATAVTLTYPLDFVRTRLAYVSESGSIPIEKDTKTITFAGARRETIRSILRTTLEREGIRGLYHGIGPSMYGILPYAGLKFYVYQHLKQLYFLKNSASGNSCGARDGRLPVPVMLLFGGVAGLVAQTVTYPLDVVRRRMQVEGLKNTKFEYVESLPKSTPLALIRIAKSEGWKCLFAGLSINYMKVIPSTAIGFSLYDHLKSKLNLPSNL